MERTVFVFIDNRKICAHAHSTSSSGRKKIIGEARYKKTKIIQEAATVVTVVQISTPDLKLIIRL